MRRELDHRVGVVFAPRALHDMADGFYEIASLLAATIGPERGPVWYARGGRVERLSDSGVIARRIVELPPVIFLLSLVALGIVFGIGGIIIAAPLTVVAYTLVRELYVRDLLKEGNLLKEEEPPLKDTIVTSVATP